MSKQKRLTFLVFNAYRIVLFSGLLGIVLFAYFFGPMIWRHYIGTGNTFRYDSGTLAVHFLDVGQGDATVIQLPDGKVVMIDSGTAHYYRRVRDYLNTRIVGKDKKIDVLIATHSHDDHIGGFPQLLAEFDVQRVYRPYNKSNSHWDTEVFPGEARAPLTDTKTYENFIDAVYEHGNDVMFARAGEKMEGNNYLLYFHTPTQEYADTLSPARYQDFNDISTIISLHYYNHYFLFTGDAGTRAENQFRDCPQAIATANEIGYENLQVYLKVGHHGSNGSTSTSFLEFIKPNKAIISVGERNLHGHPHPRVLNRLRTAGLTDEDIFQTRIFGNIVLGTDGHTDRMFFAFDNQVDLGLVYLLSAVVAFFLSFTNFNYKPSAGSEVLELKHSI
jgi:competence protein ComEC